MPRAKRTTRKAQIIAELDARARISKARAIALGALRVLRRRLDEAGEVHAKLAAGFQALGETPSLEAVANLQEMIAVAAVLTGNDLAQAGRQLADADRALADALRANGLVDVETRGRWVAKATLERVLRRAG